MTRLHLVLRGLRFYRRTHLGVAGGAAVGTAVLVGALAVGDSVRHALAASALDRLGRWALAFDAGERLFRDDLDRRLEAAGAGGGTAAALRLAGIASTADGARRVPGVRVYGVDGRFRAGAGPAFPDLPPGAVGLGAPLAGRLGVRAGDAVLLRVERIGRVSRDAPFSGEEKTTAAARVPVAAIVPDGAGGRFGLRAGPEAPLNVFVAREWLQKLAGHPGRANLLLAAEPRLRAAESALREAWTAADADLEVRDVPGRPELELRTPRVFLDPAAVRAAAAVPGSRGALAYLVNELRLGPRATPYSIVAALGDLASPGAGAPPAAPLPDLRDDEILVNAWLAEDLGAKPGDELELAYFVLGAAGNLEEARARLRVRAVLPMDGTAADRELLPDFPGLSDVDNCRDWEPGVPIDLKRIRKKDEAYWESRRGTPKAFVTLAAGRRMWSNRFGDLTAVRVPARPGAREAIAAALRRVEPSDLGAAFQPVRAQALAAAEQAQDFGRLFLGFSFFLVGSSLLLTALLFVFGVEQRAGEAGLLLAVGFTPARVRGLFLLEGGALALAGSVVGAAAGVLYAAAALYGLSTVWRSAAGVSGLRVYVEWPTLVAGALAGFGLALGAIAAAARGLGRRPARDLLTSGSAGVSLAPPPAGKRIRLGLAAAVACLAAAAGLVAWSLARPGGEAEAGHFFASGALLLLAGLGFCRALLARLDRPAGAAPGRLDRRRLARLNAVRRPGRSLAVVALLACGGFLVAAVGANRRAAGPDAGHRGSGTGGFALWAASALPVSADLNDPRGREALGLDPAATAGVSVVALRVRDGDDASCLTLHRAQVPRILGVRPESLHDRGAFALVGARGEAASWLLLRRPLGPDEIPAIGDQATLRWALGKSVGDSVEIADGRGRPMRLRLVAAVDDSLLQGALIVSEDDFVARFPGSSGYRAFLIDAPPGRAGAAAKELERALQDEGFEAVPAVRRLDAFHAVENTYLAIFLALGGLGMVLGSLGVGLVVMRNVLERRGELALMLAVGFERKALRRLVVAEHAQLLALGLLVGAASAAVAVVPALRAPGAGAPALSAALTLAAVGLSGWVWTWVAARVALRGTRVSALRDE